jgi:two-component system alkaline phosphatase synthesis response regulator PhoP
MEMSPRQLRRNPVTKYAERATEEAEAKPLSPKMSPCQSDRSALVVDAEPATLRLCREVLEGMGFVVDAADSGIAAVIAARKRLPHLILMNVQLRDVPGREAVGWLRSNPALRSTPIIILTMNAEDEASLAAVRPGASLRKPLSPVKMRHAVREVLK